MKTPLGSQIATTRLIPKGSGTDLAARLARKVGMALDPWQAEILTEASRTTGDRWSAFEVGALVPRQNGKSFLIVARALAGALVYNEKLTMYSAHEYRTAQEVWRTMRDICESDDMSSLVRRIHYGAGSEQIEFANGNRFKLIARTRTSGRGFSPDCLLLDEAFGLSEEVLASVVPSMSARPNPQIWYLSSAATWESMALLRIRQRGHDPKSKGLAFWDWYAELDDDIADPRTWAKANPAFGRRIQPSSVERELATMSKKAFQRERLGIWSESATESVIREEDIANLTVEVPRPPNDGRFVGWGVDVAWDRSGAAIAACFRDDDGNPIVTVVETRGGAGWLVHRLSQLDAHYGVTSWCYDAKGGITDLMERANRDHGVILDPLKGNDYPAACATFVQRVTDASLRLAKAPSLLSDVTSASARYLPNGWVWERKASLPPTSLIAATCAVRAWETGDANTVGVF